MTEKTGEKNKSYRKLFYVIAGLLFFLIILAAAHIRPDIPVEELLEEYAGENSSFLEINGANIHYRDEGSGEPLVLIHGWASSLHTWDDWTEILKEDFRVIRLDLPGFGLTGPVDTADYSAEYFAEIVKGLLDELNIGKSHIAGNSMGGRVTASFASNYPERTDKIILLNAAGYITESSDTLGFINTKIISFMARYITPRYIVRTMIKDVYADADKLTEETVIRYQKMLLREGNRSVIFRVLESSDTGLMNESEKEKLNNIKSPALIMWGDEDRWIPPEHAYLFENDIPDSRVIMYEDAGHVPMEEIPVRSALDASGFLSEKDQESIEEEPIPSS